jgi:hypothetical protein
MAPIDDVPKKRATSKLHTNRDIIAEAKCGRTSNQMITGSTRKKRQQPTYSEQHEMILKKPTSTAR